MTCPPEGGVGKYQGGGKISVQEQLLGAVEIGKDGVQQARALDQARFQVTPFVGRDEQRNGI